MVNMPMAIMEVMIHNMLIIDNGSLKNNNPKRNESKTIEVLLIPKITELGKIWLLRVAMRKYTVPKLTMPSIEPYSHTFNEEKSWCRIVFCGIIKSIPTIKAVKNKRPVNSELISSLTKLSCANLMEISTPPIPIKRIMRIQMLFLAGEETVSCFL